MSYHPNREDFFLSAINPSREDNRNKFNQINKRTTITFNKTNEVIHITGMSENLLNSTPNIQSMRTLSKKC